MAHEGQLRIGDSHDGNWFACSGGLDAVVADDGGQWVQGVVNLEGKALEAAKQQLEEVRSGASATAVYSGEVYTLGRRDTRKVDEMKVRIEGIDDTGNVRLKSDTVPVD